MTLASQTSGMSLGTGEPFSRDTLEVRSCWKSQMQLYSNRSEDSAGHQLSAITLSEVIISVLSVQSHKQISWDACLKWQMRQHLTSTSRLSFTTELAVGWLEKNTLSTTSKRKKKKISSNHGKVCIDRLTSLSILGVSPRVRCIICSFTVTKYSTQATFLMHFSRKWRQNKHISLKLLPTYRAACLTSSG